MFSGIEFADKWVLWLLLLIPLLVAWYVWRDRDKKNAVRFSSFALLRTVSTSRYNWMRHALFGVRMVGLFFLIVALARPQSFRSERSSTTDGIDIVMSLDVSASMLARDFTPDRLEASKTIGSQFISGRPNDRIGIVMFAAEAYTMCPLTIDHATAINQLQQAQSGVLEDGTAIGSGLAMAVSRLAESDAKSRVVILLTDGVNNSGEVAPLTAAEIAKALGVRVYAVGVGSQGTAPYPVQTPFGIRYQNMAVEIDEALLERVADMTGGKYFRATDNNALKEVYAEIDQLEKSKIQVNDRTQKEEEYWKFGVLALLLLAGEMVVRRLLVQELP